MMVNFYENVDFSKIVYWINDECEIDSSSLRELCDENVETTTTPLGVGSTYHLRHDEDRDIAGKTEEEEGWQVWTWGYGGNNPRKIQDFESQDEARHALNLLAKYDLDNGCDTPTYYATYAEAEEELKEILDDE